MAKKTNRKLGIKRETLRKLDEQQLAAVAGGTIFVGWNINWIVYGGLTGGQSLALVCNTFPCP